MKEIEQLKEYIKDKNISGLRSLSNIAIEKAIIDEDKKYVQLSLVAYALSKVFLKRHFEPFHEKIKEETLMIIDNRKDYEKLLSEILENIKKIDKELGYYMIDLVEKAKLKLAVKAYTVGLSLNKACSLTGCDRIELQSYIGTTKIHDKPYNISMPVLERFKILKKIFGEEDERDKNCM